MWKRLRAVTAVWLVGSCGLAQTQHKEAESGMRKSRGTRRMLFLAGLLLATSGVQAQMGVPVFQEYKKRLEATQQIAPLETGLFGENVNLYNGSTVFTTIDIDLPGNGALPVQLARRLVIEVQPQGLGGTYDTRLRSIGNWHVDVPHISTTYPSGPQHGWPDQRCTYSAIPDLAIGHFSRSEYWHGISVHVPGKGDANLLRIYDQVPRPSTGGPYHWATSNRDVFDCIPMQSGLPGEGFRMTTTEGLRYYFNVAVSRQAVSLVKSVYSISGVPMMDLLPRQKHYLLASKIEDRFGNTVQFQYNADGFPTRIWASDGREITLSYASGRLASASAHGRTWQYQYDANADLSAVTLPDSSQWSLAYVGTLLPRAQRPEVLGAWDWCGDPNAQAMYAYQVHATHPSGAQGEFRFLNLRHYRNGVHATECEQRGDPAKPEYVLHTPHYYDVMSLGSKIVGGPGVETMTWTYDYGAPGEGLWGTRTQPAQYPCMTCQEHKTVTVTNPDGTRQRHRFGMVYRRNDGRLLQAETLDALGNVLRTEASDYVPDAAASSQLFEGAYGIVLANTADPATAYVRPVVKRTISQQGATFTWQVAATCGSNGTAFCFSTFAHPTRVVRSSTAAGNPTRTETTEYEDNFGKWVVGQVRKVACVLPSTALPAGCGPSGTVMSETSYDGLARPTQFTSFGRIVQTLTYNADGTVATVKDGNNNATTLSSWKRGIPQLIRYPATSETLAGATHSIVVDDNGWITRVTDETGSMTCYAYDAMGRASQVTYPSEAAPSTCDTTTWNATTQVFGPPSLS